MIIPQQVKSEWLVIDNRRYGDIMDQEQLLGLGAKISKASVPYSTKMWGEGKSVGGDWSIEVDIAPESDAEAAIGGAYAWLKALAHQLMGEELSQIKHAVPTVTTSQPATTGTPSAVNEDVVENCQLGCVVLGNGQKILKLFGGKWSKFGVSMWPEVILNYPELVDYASTWTGVTVGKDGVEQPQWLQGLPYPYTRAVVQLVDSQPKRVLRLE